MTTEKINGHFTAFPAFHFIDEAGKVFQIPKGVWIDVEIERTVTPTGDGGSVIVTATTISIPKEGGDVEKIRSGTSREIIGAGESRSSPTTSES